MYTVVCPLVLVAAGYVSGRASNSGRGQWWERLKKPALQPPGYVFGIVWTLLYIMLGYSLGLMLDKGHGGSVTLFYVQIILNLLWSPLFFSLHQMRASLVLLVAIFALSAVCASNFYVIEPLAGKLMIPYLVWLVCAFYLNFEIVRIN